MHKKSTSGSDDEIMAVDTYMENHCPWKTCADEESIFDDVQTEEDDVFSAHSAHASALLDDPTAKSDHAHKKHSA